MYRLLILVAALAALPAPAFDLEKWADGLVNRQMEKWKREKLETVIKGRDADERLKAVEGLSYTDDDALAAFAVALGDSDARVRRAAASQMWSAEKKAEPYRPQLTKALDDPDANVVAYASGALQAQGVKEADLVKPRQRVLDSPEASVTSRFLVSRNLHGKEPPLKLLAPMLAYLEANSREKPARGNEENVSLAEKALERLIQTSKDRSLVAPTQEALAQTRHGHVSLLKTLGTFEPKPEGWTPTLITYLEHPNPRVRYEALSQMHRVKNEKDIAVWVPRAASMLQDPESSVRSQALSALGSARGLAAGEIDKVVAATGDPSVRRSAIRALGEIAEADQAIAAATKARVVATARPVLEAALQDTDKDTREDAKDAMRKLVGRYADAPARVAAVTPTANEAGGMATLRARKIPFEWQMFSRALGEVDVEAVRAFLDAGMSPSASLNDMGPPIRVMLFSGEACAPNVRPTKPETKAIVKLLLDRGADIHASDGHGNNALMEAASKGCDRELIRTLIKAGAKINAPNSAGLTPFEMGLWMGHDGLDELLAAGYRLPPDKVKTYLDGYKDRPAAIAMVRKAMARK